VCVDRGCDLYPAASMVIAICQKSHRCDEGTHW
jgi:hypothetical protein